MQGLPAGTLARRERVAITAGLAGASVLAWLWLVQMMRQMHAGMGDAAQAGLHAWSVPEFALTFLMWAVMMVAMMLPSAAPMSLVYAAVARKAARDGAVVAPAFVFASGYVAIWTLFSLGATLAQWSLDRALLLSPMLVTTSPVLGALLLVAAGAYQWSPAKDACLEHCRAPATFFARHWRSGGSGAFRMGLVHGAFCLGCCWALMGLLFVGGVMNLFWVAVITLFVLGEKSLPWGARGGRWAGAGLILVGLGLLVSRVG
jgi:predicted metal-binding membrane protein